MEPPPADVDWRTILRHEFEAGEASFLIQLRCDLQWDKVAFGRLSAAMLEACRAGAQDDRLERWLAEGFWYLQTFVRDWSGHPHFPRPHPAAYYDRALTKLDDLAFWFFTGKSPYEGQTGFEPL